MKKMKKVLKNMIWKTGKGTACAISRMGLYQPQDDARALEYLVKENKR